MIFLCCVVCDRNQEQQDTFEKVEVIPQAYELILSKACGIPFKVSLDNFNPDVQLDRDTFTKKVGAMAEKKRKRGAGKVERN
ncbi:MAG: elongation factor P hydroxylase [Pseudomonadota bacterium]|nr:elongation factor P hydroxylase [Pseudomonadota bacterium]